MPPRRRPNTRSSTGSTHDPAQSTLTFHGRASRITKPGISNVSNSKDAGSAAASAKKADATIATPAVPETKQQQQGDVVKHADIELEPETQSRPSTANTVESAISIPDSVNVAAPAKNEAVDPLEKQAAALPESAIESYWKGRTAKRIAPSVHVEGVSVRERVLREFDIDARFGPAIGITRLRRWHRAHNLDMEPPLEILAVLVKERDGQMNSAGAETTKKGAKESKRKVTPRTGGESTSWGRPGGYNRSYVDELMNGAQLED